MKKYLLIISMLFSYGIFAQDDLLNMLDNENPGKPTPVYATFKSTRVVNLQTNETMKKRHLDFRIMHRFGTLDFDEDNNYGAYNLFGLDAAVLRFGFEYGLTDKLMIGWGRSTIGKTYDGFIKYKLMEQTTKGKGAKPVSINYFGNIGVNTLAWNDPTRKNLFSSRLSFVNQLIISRKFNDYFSLTINPTLVHYNLVDSAKNPNDIFAIGVGGSIRLSRSTRLNIEYTPRLNGRDAFNGMYYDAFAIGVDIETGGHVFQLHLSNSSGLIEQQFIARTTDDIFKGVSKLRFGFNISRTYSFEKEANENPK